MSTATENRVEKEYFYDRREAEDFYDKKNREGLKNVKLWWVHNRGGYVEFENA